MTLKEWVINSLEQIIQYKRVLVCDPLGIAKEAYRSIDALANEHGFTVIQASTNLTFRDSYERLLQDPEVEKIMILDQTPYIRLHNRSISSAPPLFYPDFLEKCPLEARINLDLRQYLRDVTGDGNWPQACNEVRYARLMIPNLSGILTAYRNLRTVDPKGFSDSQFDTIVAYAALGIPEMAFKTLGAEEYWRIGLMGHETLYDLKNLAPNIVEFMVSQLKKAPVPFCWFADRDPEHVVNGLYLSAILQQHTEHWGLLVGNVDPSFASFKNIEEKLLQGDVPRLVNMNQAQAERDLTNLELSLESDQLELIMFDQLKIEDPDHFASVIEQEAYSSLLRSLALVVALDNALSDKSNKAAQKRVQEVLFNRKDLNLADKRNYPAWRNLVDTYKLAIELEPLTKQLLAIQKELSVKKAEKLDLAYFRNLWIDKHLGNLEYILSALERQVNSGELLPRQVEDLPSAFRDIIDSVRQRVRAIAYEVNHKIDAVNAKFQDMVALLYPEWVKETDYTDGNPVLTSRFLKKCLKPNWDPKTETAVIFIFDGMRHDIWELLLKDSLNDYMDVVQELPGLALLPTETHVSRKAISAGAFPDEFDDKKAEDKLLNESLSKLYHQEFALQVGVPDGGGTGETVHYQTNNLDVHIFELCDTELHKIKVKKLADGHEVPSRPLSYIYQQQVKNIIANEVMAIIRGLTPGTKVFITADHGFNRMGRKPLGLHESWLNIPKDCTYQNSILKLEHPEIKAGGEIKNNLISFSPKQLRMPEKALRFDPNKGQVVEHQFKTIVFPRVGYSFKRPNAPFKPDAFSHGGISLQEMLVPMVVLKVKAQDQGLLTMDPLQGPKEILEGELIEFSVMINNQSQELFPDDIRVEARANYAIDTEQYTLPAQIFYVGTTGEQVSFSFKPDTEDASIDERRQGIMKRLFTLEISYRDGHRTIRKSRTCWFNVKLNTDKIARRYPSNLSNILGMTPKSMR